MAHLLLLEVRWHDHLTNIGHPYDSVTPVDQVRTLDVGAITSPLRQSRNDKPAMPLDLCRQNIRINRDCLLQGKLRTFKNEGIMKTKIFALVLGGLTSLVTVHPVAAASLLYSEIGYLGNDLAGSQQIYGDKLYDSFSTGSSVVSLSDIKVQLSGGTANTTVTLGLYADNALTPGTLIATLARATETGLADTIVDFSLSSLVSLSADTRYWIGLTASDASLTWDYTQDTSGPGVAGEYVASLDVASNSVAVYDNPDGWPFQLQVSAVPEPAPALMLAFGLFGLGMIKRRVGV